MSTDPGAAVAEAYYDSQDADRFYLRIWGGDDIHVGLYAHAGEAIADASRRTVAAMADLLPRTAPGRDVRVLDLGAGYGGAARWLARERGAHVTCVNISQTQNDLNRAKTDAAGLADRVAVLHGSFDAAPVADGAFDVVWSQDAFLHGSDRRAILAEAARALTPGGRLIFTDIMQTDDAPTTKLQPIYDRIHLSSLGSIAFYNDAATAAGLTVGPHRETPEHLATHYRRVGEDLAARRAELEAEVSPAYIDRMLAGLRAWVDGAEAGWLTWGVLVYDKPGVGAA